MFKSRVKPKNIAFAGRPNACVIVGWVRHARVVSHRVWVCAHAPAQSDGREGREKRGAAIRAAARKVVGTEPRYLRVKSCRCWQVSRVHVECMMGPVIKVYMYESRSCPLILWIQWHV